MRSFSLSFYLSPSLPLSLPQYQGLNSTSSLPGRHCTAELYPQPRKFLELRWTQFFYLAHVYMRGRRSAVNDWNVRTISHDYRIPRAGSHSQLQWLREDRHPCYGSAAPSVSLMLWTGAAGPTSSSRVRVSYSVSHPGDRGDRGASAYRGLRSAKLGALPSKESKCIQEKH